MAFVDDDILPLDFTKGRLVVQNVLVGGEDDVKLLILEVLSEDRSFVLLAFVRNDADRWRPSFKLAHPVIDRRQWNHDQERPFVPLVSNQVRKEGNRLNRLAKTHLVR